MINALHYDGPGQRFEPHKRQSGELRQRHIDLHLNLHIHLSLGARRLHTRRLWQPTAARVTTIFAAFIGALSMALSFFIMSNGGTLHFMGPHIDLANNIMLIGALLGSGAILLGGLPLLISAWRSTPRVRLLLSTPFLIILGLLALTGMFGIMNVPLLLAELLLLAALWRPTWRWRALNCLALFVLTMPLASLLPYGIQHIFMSRWFGGNAGTAILTFFFYGIPLVSTIAIVRAIRQAKLSDRLLRFTTIPSLLVALGMLLMISGMLVWAGTVLFFLPSIFPQILGLLTLPYNSWLLQLIGMLIALVVALFAIFWQPRSHSKTQQLPHDDALSDTVSPREHGYYPVDGSKE